ncbi:MAG: type II toxin-antitoxin system HicB family antitoxin [Fibrobacter sp.]|nr:type II toxin-antitoxin system HicB family antitoxin [Fibrobacter sp.]
MHYVAKLTKEMDGGYSVEFPDLDGCFTEGDSLEEALSNAKEAMELTLMDVFDGCPLPVASTKENRRNGLYSVEVSPSMSVALEVVAARGSRSQSEVANSMGMRLQAYQRLEDPNSNLSMRMMERVAAAIGKKLVVSMV